MLCVSYINMGYRNKLREVKVPATKFNHLILKALYQGFNFFFIDFLIQINIVQLQLERQSQNLSLKRISSPACRRYISVYSKYHKSPFFIISTKRGLTPFDFNTLTNNLAAN